MSCGHENDSKMSFCSNCGVPLTNDATTFNNASTKANKPTNTNLTTDDNDTTNYKEFGDRMSRGTFIAFSIFCFFMGFISAGIINVTRINKRNEKYR